MKMRVLPVGFVVLGSLLPCVFGDIGCRDNAGNPVDWFIVYKLPKLEESSEELVRNGVGQAYMDTNHQELTLLDKGVNQTDHAIYNTLEQIYKNSDSESFSYLLYNDEAPDQVVSLNHGHTKGDVAFDKTSGFWLVHSVPKFPPPAESGYLYPNSGTIYGQSFLCITIDYKQFNGIGEQLLYNYPKIYDYNFPSAFEKDNPAISDALKMKHVQSKPWNKTLVLTSSGGRQFISFAKFSTFGKDLYHDWVAPYFDSGLLTETWQHGRGRMDSNCSGHEVLNIQNLRIVGQDFSEMEDHSKWAVSYSSADESRSDGPARWTCIGDINRMVSQTKRAGGTVCSSLESVWNNFNSTIKAVEQCDRFKNPQSRFKIPQSRFVRL